MNTITIIGLGLVGNSIGMGLKRAAAAGQQFQVVGFDPDRSREEAALRKHFSVDSIAPDLQRAVAGAQLVIISTPASAAREVLEAIGPLLESGCTVTDTLSIKGPIMSWAGELLGNGISFVGGHPLSRTIDVESSTDEDMPSADLFQKAPYCIMPLPTASSDALNNVIGIAQVLGAQPLFMDPFEHDSFSAAVSGLPVLAGTALLRVTSGSPSWADILALAQGQFGSATQPLASDPVDLRDALVANRQSLLHWTDQYMLALQDLRDLVASPDAANPSTSAGQALLSILESAHDARARWASPEKTPSDDEGKFQADMRQAITDAQPLRNMMGSYISDRFFRKKEDK